MREYTPFATSDDRAYLSILVNENSSPCEYSAALRQLGSSLAESVLKQLGPDLPKRLCIVCTVEDADSLAAGIISTLEEKGLAERIRVVCFWNDRIELEGRSFAPILKEYREPCEVEDSALLIVKSIVSSACVVRTNLANLIARATPQRILVVAPVMFKGADESLRNDFEQAIGSRFEYVTLAIDDEKRDGKWVVPGVGGDIYTRLGYGGVEQKNRHVPTLIKARRQQAALNA
jgi:pyrimidine operon attenuation protein/uracil phosphoribosyltransferase